MRRPTPLLSAFGGDDDEDKPRALKKLNYTAEELAAAQVCSYGLRPERLASIAVLSVNLDGRLMFGQASGVLVFLGAWMLGWLTGSCNSCRPRRFWLLDPE